MCHMPFRDGDTVYEMNQENGTPNPYHMTCFYETSQGRMGYSPTREYVFGQQLTLDFIAQRFTAVQ